VATNGGGYAESMAEHALAMALATPSSGPLVLSPRKKDRDEKEEEGEMKENGARLGFFRERCRIVVSFN
jgi:hypothetical protein